MLCFLHYPALRNFRTYILGFLHLSIWKTSVFSLVQLALFFYKNPAFILICDNIPRSAKEIKKNLKPMGSVSHTCENPAFQSTVCSEAIGIFYPLYHLHWWLFPLPIFFLRSYFPRKFGKGCKKLCSCISFCVWVLTLKEKKKNFHSSVCLYKPRCIVSI